MKRKKMSDSYIYSFGLVVVVKKWLSWPIARLAIAFLFITIITMETDGKLTPEFRTKKSWGQLKDLCSNWQFYFILFLP